MNTVEEIAQIRHAYYNEGKKIRQIAREQHRSRATIRRALGQAEIKKYVLRRQKAAPVLDEWKPKIDGMLIESDGMPRKQRYTGQKIYDLLKADGYGGCITSVRNYVAQKRPHKGKQQDVFLPLAFDPGKNSQLDWGEAVVKMNGERVTVQVLDVRLCYSRASFVCAYPTQRQEALFDGHVRAMHFFGGVTETTAYDNMATVVILGRRDEALNPETSRGRRSRREQELFTAFRSAYLFKSRFCTPGQGHEKGQVEHSVGYTRRNFMVPMLEAQSFDDLNEQLLQACLKDQQRTVSGQNMSIFEALQIERQHLRPLPDHDYLCCITRQATVNGYGQITFESNRYSLPVNEIRRMKTRVVTVRAFAFKIEVLIPEEARIIASHPRCYQQHQDICEPQHYLPLLLQRPGAFEHARPMRQWRAIWPAAYDTLYERLCEGRPDGSGVREFLRVLGLHETYAAADIEQAVKQALACGSAHFEGVKLCLHRLQHPEQTITLLPAAQQPRLPSLEWAGVKAADLQRYDLLLTAAADSSGAQVMA
jgi:transposase